MSSEGQFTPRPDPTPPTNGAVKPPPAGLPPVAPPSGKLMLQLFLVPGLIVAVLVVFWLLGGWIFGVSYSKESFLSRLRDPNAEVRWRAAENLARCCCATTPWRPTANSPANWPCCWKRLATPPVRRKRDTPSSVKTLNKEDAKAEQAKLEPDRNFVSYLGACLGGFMVPVGAPVLKELATQDRGIEPKALALQRRQAVWALANLGENLKRFDKLSGPQKDAVLDQLRVALWDAAGGGDRQEFLKLPADQKDAALAKLDAPAQPQHADWLRDALRCLRERAQGVDDDMGVGDALIACSRDQDDPNLRELSAFAMNFWRGDDAANARMEKALVALIQDTGEGDDQLTGAADEKNDGATEAVSKVPGLEVRFNAAAALARFGSKDARLDVLKDMLDDNYLRNNFVLRPRNGGPDRPNEEVVGQTLTNALTAVAELHKRRPDMDLSTLKPAVDALAASGNPDLRSEAEKTKLALN